MASGSVTRNLIVGFAFLGSLVLLGAATLLIKGVALFAESEAKEVRFPEVDQLQPGDRVVAHGFRVGQVDAIRYEPDGSPVEPIVVRMRMLKSLADRLPGGTTYTIRSSGPLGGQYLEIIPPPSTEAPRKDPTRPVGEAPGDLFERLENLVEKNEESLTRAIAEIRRTFEAINAGEGPLGALVKDSALRDRVSQAVTDVTEVIAEMKKNLREERGTIGLLLSNEKTKEDVRLAVEDLREIVRQVRQGEGLAAALINDPKMAARLTETLEDIHDIVHKVNTGQGTLGQFINNPRGWEELVKFLVLSRETIEDIREQAPVSTFVNALFSAF